MEINFKFLPAFLGALALTAVVDVRSRRPAPVPAVPSRAAVARVEAPRGAPRDGEAPTALASNRVAGPASPARPAPASPDDW